MEREGSWCRIVDNEYESLAGQWCTKGITGAYGVRL